MFEEIVGTSSALQAVDLPRIKGGWRQWIPRFLSPVKRAQAGVIARAITKRSGRSSVLSSARIVQGFRRHDWVELFGHEKGALRAP